MFGSLVKGNFIGLNGAGNAALPNVTGISLSSSSTKSVIGGADPLDKNIISGNSNIGISVSGTSHTIQNNYIGLNPDGSGVIKNATEGLRFSGTLTNTQVSENTISGNGTILGQSGIPPFNAANGVHFFSNKVGSLPNGNTGVTNIGGGLIFE